MAVHEDLERLDRVDKLDRERTRLKQAIEAHERALAEAEQALTDAAEALERAEAAVTANEKEQKAHQRALLGHQNNRDAALRLLESGQGNAEAAERQVQRTSALIDEVETAILELLESLDDAETARRAARDRHVHADARAWELRGSTPVAIEALRAESDGLRQERDGIFGQLPAAIRRRYDDWRQRKKWAVARVVGSTCDGCRMEVPAQLRSDLLHGRLETCQRCHRWLIPPVEASSATSP